MFGGQRILYTSVINKLKFKHITAGYAISLIQLSLIRPYSVYGLKILLELKDTVKRYRKVSVFPERAVFILILYLSPRPASLCQQSVSFLNM